eukprot:s1438_g3.t1
METSVVTEEAEADAMALELEQKEEPGAPLAEAAQPHAMEADTTDVQSAFQDDPEASSASQGGPVAESSTTAKATFEALPADAPTIDGALRPEVDTNPASARPARASAVEVPDGLDPALGRGTASARRALPSSSFEAAGAAQMTMQQPSCIPANSEKHPAALRFADIRLAAALEHNRRERYRLGAHALGGGAPGISEPRWSSPEDGAMIPDVSELPPAGAYRGRLLGPRELLARSGCHALSPPLHPKVQELHTAMPGDPDYSRHRMQLSRSAEPHVLEATVTLDLAAGSRPAGVGGFFQTAKHRAEFKQHAVVGQFSNEVPSSIPQTRKAFQMHRGEGPAYQGHQQATSAFRRDLERSGHL